MKTIVLICVIFSLAYADSSTTSPGSTETSNKSETKSQNSIPSPPSSPAKAQYYTPRAPTFVQLIQKPLFATHGPGGIPQTMLIIAQPALLPHNLVYNQASTQHAQQLLNYFHSNPAAKYQLLYNYQPQQQAAHSQPHVAAPVAQTPVYYSTSPHSYQNYQYLTPQQYTYIQPQTISIPQQYTSQQAPSYHTPQYQIPASTYTHLHQLQLGPTHSDSSTNSQQSGSTHTSNAHTHTQTPFIPSPQLTPTLAQSLHQVSSQLHSQYQHPTTQHLQPAHVAHSQSHTQRQSNPKYSSNYYSQAPQTFTTQTPVKTVAQVAPIITGLENFTPEQQAQIKEQLSNHFGGITQINSNSLQANGPEYQTKYRIEVQTPETEYTSTAAQAESSSLKQDSREEQPTIQQEQHQHQPHYLQQTQSHNQGSFTPPVYTYRTPQYTKG